MRRQPQWLFEAPFSSEGTFNNSFNSQDFLHPGNWEQPQGYLSSEYEYEYVPSSVRRAFENSVRQADWRNAYLNLNGLNMYEMLRALDGLSPDSLTELWKKSFSF